MINYSITMRPVNANLIEINLAKGRIKAAQSAGQTPDPADEALAASVTQKAFAIAQYSDVMTIEKFARHISDHGCVYSRADIAAILYLAVDCMREQLLDGKKIRLGDLGDFSIAIASKGADTAEKFSAANITSVQVTWDPGKQFKNLLTDAEFNLVASRAAQAAVIKAIKAGKDSVTLTPNEQETPTPDPDNTNPDPDNTDSGNNNTDSGNNTTVNYNLSVNASPANGGSVTGGGSYAQGATATLTATPASGYRFVQWSDGNTQASRTVTVTEDKSLTATFATTGSTGGTGGGTEEG